MQALVNSAGRFVVVTRHKKDFLQLQKKAGKVASNVDSRLVVEVERATFDSRENFVVQVSLALKQLYLTIAWL